MKICYLIPTFVFASLMFIFFIHCGSDNSVTMVLVAAALGGSLSIMHGLPKVRFDQLSQPGWYFASGCERVFLAIIASSIAAIVMRSELVFESILSDNKWVLETLLILAAFSESLVPSMLGKMEKKA